MSMNDPLGDLLTRIRNAQMRSKNKVSSPNSRLRESVLEVLKSEGYIRGYAVVEREGRITGYASDVAFFGHTTAETNLDLQALIVSVESFGGPGILVPSRNAALFRWCLANGLRVTQPLTLMSMGLYNEPKGPFLPSILY